MVPELSKRDSQMSGLTSSSEASDSVHPLMAKFKKTRSMAPKFEQNQFTDTFNEALPK